MKKLNLYQEHSLILFEEDLITGNSQHWVLRCLRSAGVYKIYFAIIQIYRSFFNSFFLSCLKNLPQQNNSIKRGFSQVPLKFSVIKTNHFKPRFLQQGFNRVRLLLVRAIWDNFEYFVQQTFRIWIINDGIFSVQEELIKLRDI